MVNITFQRKMVESVAKKKKKNRKSWVEGLKELVEANGFNANQINSNFSLIKEA